MVQGGREGREGERGRAQVRAFASPSATTTATSKGAATLGLVLPVPLYDPAGREDETPPPSSVPTMAPKPEEKRPDQNVTSFRARACLVHTVRRRRVSECAQEQGVREGRRERDARRGIASQVLPLKPASTLAVAIVSYHSGSHSA